MKKILLLITALTGLSSCATYYVNEVQETESNEEKNHRELRNEPAPNEMSLQEAVKIDAEIIKDTVDSIKETIDINSQAPTAPAHSGSDSNLCKKGSTKICTERDGCSCID